ncbi:MAG: uncharacterized protein QOG64_1562 [Acidimicrobiaceae bacterium]|nr:uncharacterized protein [Acidimicrobiaceae bacterium]
MDLSATEARVIGCLIEKQATTPQYYPLTMNALVTACNQTSNRNPIVTYDETTVEDALTTLREQGLTRIVHSVHNRATKYRHVLDEQLAVDQRALAVLAVLLLRGPQTVGELRTRTERLADFESLGEVEATLEELARRDPPLLVRLERQPGQKEARYAHLLSGEVAADAFTAADGAERTGRGDRIAALEDEVAALRDEVARLRADVEEVRALLD